MPLNHRTKTPPAETNRQTMPLPPMHSNHLCRPPLPHFPSTRNNRDRFSDSCPCQGGNGNLSPASNPIHIHIFDLSAAGKVEQQVRMPGHLSKAVQPDPAPFLVPPTSGSPSSQAIPYPIRQKNPRILEQLVVPTRAVETPVATFKGSQGTGLWRRSEPFREVEVGRELGETSCDERGGLDDVETWDGIRWTDLEGIEAWCTQVGRR
jgi:hypothetical protein